MSSWANSPAVYRLTSLIIYCCFCWSHCLRLNVHCYVLYCCCCDHCLLCSWSSFWVHFCERGCCFPPLPCHTIVIYSFFYCGCASILFRHAWLPTYLLSAYFDFLHALLLLLFFIFTLVVCFAVLLLFSMFFFFFCFERITFFNILLFSINLDASYCPRNEGCEEILFVLQLKFP